MITSTYRFQLLPPVDSGPQRTIMFEDPMYTLLLTALSFSLDIRSINVLFRLLI